jgi:CRISPR-associated protein Csb2
MDLVITAVFPTGTFDAGEPDDRDRPEWPPHPARLFCALVSAARDDTDHAALTWLERGPAPIVCVPAEHRPLRRTGYVITNVLSRGPGNQTHPGRTNGLRTRSSTAMDPPIVCFVWTGTAPLPGTVRALDRLARCVPYLGRSTSPAVLDVRQTDGWFPPCRPVGPGGGESAPTGPVTRVEPAEQRGSATPADLSPGKDGPTGTAVSDGSAKPDGPTDRARRWTFLEPCGLLDSEAALRVPYPGYLEELSELHASGLPAWEAGKTHGYRTRSVSTSPRPSPRAAGDRPANPGEPEVPGHTEPVGSTEPAADTPPRDAESSESVGGTGSAERPGGTVPSQFPDIVLFRFLDHAPPGRMAAQCAAALRHEILESCGRPAPEVLHGHGADGRPHVAFLAVPDVGFSRSDGHLLGVGVALPEMPEDEQRTILRAVHGLRGPDGSRTASIDLNGHGRLRMMRVSGTAGEAGRWGLTVRRWRRPCRRWASVTPVILDRYPKRPEDFAKVIRRSCREADLPDPVDLRITTAPHLPGTVPFSSWDLPKRARKRLYRHVVLEFDRPVTGPVLLGAGRYQGIGLLAPFPEGAPRGGPPRTTTEPSGQSACGRTARPGNAREEHRDTHRSGQGIPR